MFRLLSRMFLLRFLPARLVPILTAYELYRLVRRLRATPKTAPPTIPATTGSADPAVAKGGRARVGR